MPEEKKLKLERLDCPLSKIELLDIRHGKFVYKHWHCEHGLIYSIIGSRLQTKEEQHLFDRNVGQRFIGLNVVLNGKIFIMLEKGVLLLKYPEAEIELHVIDTEQYEEETGVKIL